MTAYNTMQPPRGDSQINWLELARFAAEGQGHSDLGRGVRRLATLAAAVHRQHSASVIGAQVAELISEGGMERDFRAHGRAPQTGLAGTDAGSIVTEDVR